MKSLLLTLSAFMLFLHPIEQTTETKNEVHFSIPKFFWSVEGTFHNIEASAHFDPEHLDQSTISGKVYITSIDTENKTRDGHLQGEDWLNSETYPTIGIKSTFFQKVSELEYSGIFEITIKDVTQTDTIPFTVDRAINPTLVAADFSLQLTDYGVGSGKGADWVVGDQVDISVSLLNQPH